MDVNSNQPELSDFDRKRLLAEPVNIAGYGAYGPMAVRHPDRIDLLEWFMDALDKVEQNAPDALTPSYLNRLLELAVDAGHVGIVEALVNHNCDPDYVSSHTRRPMLVHAIQANNLVMVDRLLDLGANPNMVLKNGYQPLDFAKDDASAIYTRLISNKPPAVHSEKYIQSPPLAVPPAGLSR